MSTQEPLNQLQPLDGAPFEEESISFREIFHILWLRRWVMASVIVSLMAVAVLIIYQLTPQYTASSTLMLGLNKTQVVDIDAVLTGDLANQAAIMSEVEVLKSRELARKVIEKLKLAETEEFNPSPKEPGVLASLNPLNLLSWVKDALGVATEEAGEISEREREQLFMASLTDTFLGRLKIEPVRMSQVIRISYEVENPKLAAAIANAVADQYILGQLEAKFDATKKATEWLNEQLSDLKVKVEESERAVEIYRQQHGLTKAGGDVLSSQQLSEINSQLIVARTQRAEAEARLRQVERLLRAGDSLESSSEVMASPMIQNIRSQETTLQRKISEMSVEYGHKHPKMIQVHAELNDLREKLKKEIKKIAANLRNEAEVARTRENTLASSLRQLQTTAGGDKRAEVALRTLEREAVANRTLFETFLNRFKETSSTQGIQEADARIISKAEVPVTPSFPNKARMLILSFVGALLAAFGIAFLLEKLNPGLRSPEQIESFLGRSTIGLIPYHKDPNPLEYVLKHPHSSLAEAISSLRVSLMLLNPDKAVKTVLVTSSVPEEGKSTLALFLGRVAAKAGQRVVIVDTDVRRPAVEKMLGLEKRNGLTDYLVHREASYHAFIVKDEASGLDVMPKGNAEFVNPADLFSSRRMETLIDQLQQDYDLVILDSPPVMSVTDGRLLSKLVDKTVFVIRWDHTPREVAKTAIQQIASAGNNVAGVVLQRVNLKQYGRYSYGESSYYYHYGKYRHYYTNS